MRQVERRHKAGFGAAGLGTAQSWFWSRHKAGFGAVGLGSAQSRFWSRQKAAFGAVGLGSAQSRFWSRHKAGFGAAGYKTGFVSRQVLHLLSKLQNSICPKMGQYKTCIVSNTKIESSTRATKPKPWQGQIQFCSFDRRFKTCLDTKPVLYQGRFCSLTNDYDMVSSRRNHPNMCIKIYSVSSWMTNPLQLGIKHISG